MIKFQPTTADENALDVIRDYLESNYSNGVIKRSRVDAIRYAIQQMEIRINTEEIIAVIKEQNL